MNRTDKPYLTQDSTSPTRYSGIITSQCEGVSYIDCKSHEGIHRIFTTHIIGVAEIGKTVEFELSHPFPTTDRWWVKNARIIPTMPTCTTDEIYARNEADDY